MLLLPGLDQLWVEQFFLRQRPQNFLVPRPANS
jgi:hypothetical protein